MFYITKLILYKKIDIILDFKFYIIENNKMRRTNKRAKVIILFLDEGEKLQLVKYNNILQKKRNISIINYYISSGYSSLSWIFLIKEINLIYGN